MDLRSDKQCKNPYTKCFFIKHFFYSLPKLNGKRMRKRAIEQGILIFPAGAATDVQVAGRTLLQRGIRTMGVVNMFSGSGHLGLRRSRRSSKTLRASSAIINRGST